MPNEAQPTYSNLIDQRVATVALQPNTAVPPLTFQVFIDWRAAPNDSAAAMSVLAMSLGQAHALISQLARRVAALEVFTAENERPGAVDPLGSLPFPNDRAFDEQRIALALACIGEVAERVDAVTAFTPTPASEPERPASALDQLELGSN